MWPSGVLFSPSIGSPSKSAKRIDYSQIRDYPIGIIGIVPQVVAVKLSTRMRYAARALAELARVPPPGTASLRAVAGSQDISPKYLEGIFNILRERGVLRTVRGPHGGYALARPPEAISLREVYEIVDGPFAAVDCVDCPESCPRNESCPTRDTWVEIRQAVVDVLQRTTIRDLAERQDEKAAAAERVDHVSERRG